MVILEPVTWPRKSSKVHVIITNIDTIKSRIIGYIQISQEVTITRERKELGILTQIKSLQIITTTIEIIKFRAMGNIYIIKLNISIYCSRGMRDVKLSNFRVMTQIKRLHTRVTYIQNLQFWILRDIYCLNIRHIKTQTLQLRTSCRVNSFQTQCMICIERTKVRKVTKCEIRRDMSYLWYLQNNQVW